MSDYTWLWESIGRMLLGTVLMVAGVATAVNGWRMAEIGNKQANDKLGITARLEKMNK